MCRSSFDGFIASFDNLLLQIKQSGQGASESPVEINPYFRDDSLYCRLKALFVIVGPSVSTSDSSDDIGPFPKKKLSMDVCFVGLPVLVFLGLKIEMLKLFESVIAHYQLSFSNNLYSSVLI